MRLAVLSIACSMCLLELAPGTARQQTPAQPTFRAAVDLVHLDVSVLDKNRKPVIGLTAADFTVLEDGKPQAISAFSAVGVPELESPPAAWMRQVSSDVQTNVGSQAPESRLFVILLDDGLIPDDPASIKNARDIARTIVDRVLPSDRVAVVFSVGSRGTQNFTNDRSKLHAAIETLNAGHARHLMGWDIAPITGAPLIDGDIVYLQGSMRTLRDVADTLIAAPQRRKALFYIGPGIPIDIASKAMPVPAGYREGTEIVSLARRDANEGLANAMPLLFQRMQQANVTVYPIDPCGAGGLEAYVARVAATVPRIQKAPSTPPENRAEYLPPSRPYDWLSSAGVPPAYYTGIHMARLEMDFLLATASNTGGIAIVNTNDFTPGLDKAFLENSSYYLIGYRTPPANKPGSFHRLTVKVNRPDVIVRTRTSYEMPAAEKADAKNPVSPLKKAIAGPVASDDLPLQVSLLPIDIPGQNEPLIAVVLGMRQRAVPEPASQTVDLETTIFGPDGKYLGGRHQTTIFTMFPLAGSDETRYEVLSHFPLAPGRYELRIAAHRASDNSNGSVYADLTVPDFRKAPLSVSGVMFTATPATLAAPSDAFIGLLNVTPTTRRIFKATDKAAVVFRIYQGGDAPLGPAAIAITLTDSHDTVLAKTNETFATTRFEPERSADVRFPLPIADLPAGSYLLGVEISSGKTTIGRSLRFEVTR